MQLPLLTSVERDCLDRYLDLLRTTLRDDLIGIWVFGSVARAESWPQGMPIRSDLDLLVVTASEGDSSIQQDLLDATYPLFLESGRQIGPQFLPAARVREPKDDRTASFLEQLGREAVPVWCRPDADVPLPLEPACRSR